MKGIRIGVMGLALATGLAAPVFGGTLDSPAATSDTNSAMYTLENIYQRLTTGAVTNKVAFTEPTNGPASTMHTLNDLYAVAGMARVEKTGMTNSLGAKDDGTLQVGLPWPNPRFTALTGAETNCVKDNLTGLIWTKDDSQFPAQTNWPAALANVNGLTYGGHSDWRVPNIRELYTLADYSRMNNQYCTPNTTLLTASYSKLWTSTYYNGGYAVTFDFNNTTMSIKGTNINASGCWIWPVRGP